MEGREGKKRPQPDLIIEGNMQGRPEYVFEAKRLKKNGFGVGKYLGSDGLGCFVSGKYAPRKEKGHVPFFSLQRAQRSRRKKI